MEVLDDNLLYETQLLITSRNLEFFTSSYRHLIQILPAAVVAPLYFSGKIEFGVINQSLSAFNHILGDFSLIVYQFQAISAFAAVINRLGEFDDILEGSSSSKFLSDKWEEICITYQNIKASSVLESSGSAPTEKYEPLLQIENLTVKTPSKATLIRELSLTIKEKDCLLVKGPSGSGKTSLLRALAGLWNTGIGKITYHVKDGEPQPPISSDMNTGTTNTALDAYEGHGKSTNKNSLTFFLPQRPYMVLGTLRQQLLYPTWVDKAVPKSESNKRRKTLPFLMKSPSSDNLNEKPLKPTTDELTRVLKDVHLGYLLARFSLDSTQEWSSVLSLGEQQRLAFARLLLSKPQLALLDESTSALDEANEVHLYKKIKAAGITYISIGHRPTLRDYHNKILQISPLDSDSYQLNWCIESVGQDS